MKNYLTIICVFIFYHSQSQTTFQRIYKNGTASEFGNGFCLSSDGNYMVSGYYFDFTASEGTLMKVDTHGSVLWKKEYSGSDSLEILNAIVPSVNGGYAVAGQSNNRMCILKTDSAGNVAWCQNYAATNSHDYATCIIQDADGGYLLTGGGYDNSNLTGMGFVVKTDSVGDPIWDLVLSAPGHFVKNVNHISLTSDGGSIVTGYYLELNYRLMLIKLDANGQILWSRIYGDNIRGSVTHQTNDGGYITIGTGNPGGQSGYVLMKTDSTGMPQWSKVYTEGVDYPDLIVNSDGDFLIAGTHQDGVVDSANIYLIKTNPLGDTIWTRFYETDSILNYKGESAHRIIQTPDGGYLVGAKADEKDSDISDFYLVKTDGEGMAGCNLVNRDIAIATIIPVVDSAVTFSSGFTNTLWIPPVFSPLVTDTTLCFFDRIDEPDHQLPIEVYPNPAGDFVNIYIPFLSNGELDLEVFDLTGRSILRQKITVGITESVDVSGFSKGVYIVRISSDNESGVRYFCRQ